MTTFLFFLGQQHTFLLVFFPVSFFSVIGRSAQDPLSDRTQNSESRKLFFCRPKHPCILSTARRRYLNMNKIKYSLLFWLSRWTSRWKEPFGYPAFGRQLDGPKLRPRPRPRDGPKLRPRDGTKLRRPQKPRENN